MKMDHRHYGTERRLSAVASHREGNTRGREYAPCETITEMPPWETKKEACVWQRLPLGSAGRTSGRTSGRTVFLQAAGLPSIGMYERVRPNRFAIPIRWGRYPPSLASKGVP